MAALDFDLIEALARAVLGQLHPLTGTRGTGSVLITNATLDPIVLPKNQYLIPVVRGELADDLLFKTAANPATLTEHGEAGDWTIPATGTLSVPVKSNLGGVRHNLGLGTVFRFDPALTGLAATATLDADIVDGADGSLLQRATYYEDLDPSQLGKDIQSGRLSQFPALALCWMNTQPGEGRTSGTNQGSTRLADGVRMMRETFRMFIVSGTYDTDRQRRASGLRVLQAVTNILTDQQMTTDFEQLVSVGSLEVTNRSRFARGDKHYVYSLEFRLNIVLRREDDRTFLPFLQVNLSQALPGREAPEPTVPYEVVDIAIPIPPGLP